MNGTSNMKPKQLNKSQLILLAHKKIQMLNKITDDFYNQDLIHHSEYNEMFDQIRELTVFIENSDFYKSDIPDD